MIGELRLAANMNEQSSWEPLSTSTPPERPVGQVRGTRDWLANEASALFALERALLDRFALAGYEPIRTPILEYSELHERKSGAGIVAKLYEVAGGAQNRLCLRPELTASIVRAYTDARVKPTLPWRVSMSGPVFRVEAEPKLGHYREFQQVGVELLGASGAEADGEVIGLADLALREIGIDDATLRVGHVGLILEMLRRSGLPIAAQTALIEMLSEAATEGQGVRALEHGLERLDHWLTSSSPDDAPAPIAGTDDGSADRLFRTLVPSVTGRRSGHEILGRLRRKWDLGHSLHGVLASLHAQIHELADLRGPYDSVLDRLECDYRDVAPASVGALRDLRAAIAGHGLAPNRVELDLGFGRGIGFYTQMIFELAIPTADGPVEVCGGGRYDGLARVLGSERDGRGVGFAFGLERLYHVLQARGHDATRRERSGVLIVTTGTQLSAECAAVSVRLRRRGVRAVLESSRSGVDALARARELNLAHLVVPLGLVQGQRRYRVVPVDGGSDRELTEDRLDEFARDAAEELRR
jgi:histidyl-tRNA synthetase